MSKLQLSKGPLETKPAAGGLPRSDGHVAAADKDVFPSERPDTGFDDSNPLFVPSNVAKRNAGLWKAIGIGVGMLVVAGVTTGVVVANWNRWRSAPPPQPAATQPAGSLNDGAVLFSARPEGAQVTVDGVLRGVTPLKLTLPVGEHTLLLQNGTATRSLPFVVAAGMLASQYVDLAPSLATGSGRLEVSSDPPGASVLVDGQPRGVTPLAIAAIAPGVHRVVIANGDSAVSRSVDVGAGATATVVATITPTGTSAGWVTVIVPFELQILEGGKVLGTTAFDRLMLAAGRHELEFVSDAFQFRTTMPVQVAAGRTSDVTVSLPNGSLSINATPWANVSLDGKAVGVTPLANLVLPIGRHEIVWTHPQLGERKQTVSVTAQAPVRVGIDFKK